MTKQLLIVFFISLFLTLSACSTNTKQMPGDVISDDYEGGDPSLDDAATSGLEGEGGLSMSGLDDVIAQSGNVVYFDYNSAEIRDDSIPLIMAAAESLSTNPAAQLRLEGHADERGTREFNLALGEQRAKSVRDLIMLQGVSGNQLDIVSYGEEKPAVIGTGEQSWQQNRRVEIIK
ncbi:MAG: peptidoglycan-associated lipoprotein Pal [Gammaproteobacteria bacterium]|nr:peptidoglycan-associated lipoprotein Pal [Gammaproteobacteria bacterium]